MVVRASPSVPRSDVPFRTARCRPLRQPSWLPLSSRASARHIPHVVMKRRWPAFLVLILAVTLFGWCIHAWVFRAPTYQGKSAGAWFAEFARTINPREETASLNALRALGPATVPVLLNA